MSKNVVTAQTAVDLKKHLNILGHILQDIFGKTSIYIISIYINKYIYKQVYI